MKLNLWKYSLGSYNFKMHALILMCSQKLRMESRLQTALYIDCTLELPREFLKISYLGYTPSQLNENFWVMCLCIRNFKSSSNNFSIQSACKQLTWGGLLHYISEKNLKYYLIFKLVLSFSFLRVHIRISHKV